MTVVDVYASADVIARSIAAGEVSAVEVAQAHLDRIEAVDDRVHAFLHVDRNGALEQARAVDHAVASGQPLSPLAGVPLAMKDVLTQTGIPTTCGSKILEGWLPPYNSTVVERLLAAGVVLLGHRPPVALVRSSPTADRGRRPRAQLSEPERGRKNRCPVGVEHAAHLGAGAGRCARFEWS